VYNCRLGTFVHDRIVSAVKRVEFVSDVDRRWHLSILDVRSFRAADRETHHYQEETNSRLGSRNAFYQSVQNLLFSRLLSTNLKIKIYLVADIEGGM
jgi:hypothetical protein